MLLIYGENNTKKIVKTYVRSFKGLQGLFNVGLYLTKLEEQIGEEDGGLKL